MLRSQTNPELSVRASAGGSVCCLHLSDQQGSVRHHHHSGLQSDANFPLRESDSEQGMWDIKPGLTGLFPEKKPVTSTLFHWSQ